MTLKQVAESIPFHQKLSPEIVHYLDIYESYFKNYSRYDKLKILEIGVHKGGSLAIWQEYFPNAEIHGIDIGDKRKVKVGTFHLGDQTDMLFLEKIATEHGPFDIIIDDGGHTTNQQITSFVTLFKHTDLYIIEDTCTAYWPEVRQSYNGNIFHYLFSKVNEMHVIHQTRQRGWTAKEYAKARKLIKKEIEFIHFYDSIVFIKRAKDV